MIAINVIDIDIGSYLKSLEGIVELGLAGSSRWSHDNSRWNRRDGPTELVPCQHSKFVAVRGSQVIHDIVLMPDIVSQIHPVDVGV